MKAPLSGSGLILNMRAGLLLILLNSSTYKANPAAAKAPLRNTLAAIYGKNNQPLVKPLLQDSFIASERANFKEPITVCYHQ